MERIDSYFDFRIPGLDVSKASVMRSLALNFPRSQFSSEQVNCRPQYCSLNIPPQPLKT